MDVKCPECKEKFDLGKNDYEEGDFVECPECGASLTVKVEGGKFKLATEKEELYEYDEIDFEED